MLHRVPDVRKASVVKTFREDKRETLKRTIMRLGPIASASEISCKSSLEATTTRNWCKKL